MTKLRHTIGGEYLASSTQCGTGCFGACPAGCCHPALELRGLDDCYAIACKRCGKRWCNEQLDKAAIARMRDS